MRNSGSIEATDSANRLDDAVDGGHVTLLEARQRDHCIVARHSSDWCQKTCEASFGDQRRNLASKAASARCLVDNDAAAGLGDRSKNGVFVIGLKSGKIDDLGSDALAR